MVKSTNQSCKFGGSKRTEVIEKEVASVPGPGNYNDEFGFGKGKGYSIQGKKGDKYNENPGPGSYSRADELTRPKT